MNGELNEFKYTSGLHNPGCFLYVNGQSFKELRRTAEEEIPEFQRGKISSKFKGYLKVTIADVYVGDEEELVKVFV